MCDMCNGMSLAEANAKIDAFIERHGWAVQYVEDKDPGKVFGYTIGLTVIGEPEFLVRGMTMGQTQDMFSGLVDCILLRGEHFGNGHTATWIDGRHLYFSRMRRAQDFAYGAFNRYGPATRVLEIHFMNQPMYPRSTATQRSRLGDPRRPPAVAHPTRFV